jgi:hypothetical protein
VVNESACVMGFTPSVIRSCWQEARTMVEQAATSRDLVEKKCALFM